MTGRQAGVEEVPPGYKRTEVGMIPEDWKCTSLGAVVNLLTGFPFSSSGYTDSGIPLLRGSNVKRGILDWEEEITKYWSCVTPDISQYELREGDLVIAMDGALVGRSYAVVSVADLPSLLLQRVARLRSSQVHQDLLVWWIASDSFVQYVDSVKTHTAIPHISPRDICDFTIVIPTDLPEQRAIAAALSDADGLIGALDALIEKKRAIKQAAMQQLLTGKKRLPGFSGEWEVIHLRDLLVYERPDRYIVQSTEYSEQGDFPVLTANKSFILGHTTEDFGICRAIPVIIFDDFTTESKFVDFPFKVKSSAIKILRSKHDWVDLRFVFNRMQLINFSLGDHKRYYISEYQNLGFAAPSYDEQHAIATVLSDMDAEIAALERRREKAEQIKQGMMQQLLTGRIRLVEPAETAA